MSYSFCETLRTSRPEGREIIMVEIRPHLRTGRMTANIAAYVPEDMAAWIEAAAAAAGEAAVRSDVLRALVSEAMVNPPAGEPEMRGRRREGGRVYVSAWVPDELKNWVSAQREKWAPEVPGIKNGDIVRWVIASAMTAPKRKSRRDVISG